MSNPVCLDLTSCIAQGLAYARSLPKAERTAFWSEFMTELVGGAKEILAGAERPPELRLIRGGKQ